ncbi:MAG: GNAT family N-acetyltransferase [Chromatiales bacterium]|jgi:putative acetyltransferase
MEVRVRGARASDAPAVSRLYYETVHRVNSRDYRPDQIAAWAPRVHPAEFWVRRWRRYRVLVAEVGGQVAGFAELGDEGHIACFYVHHAWQGRGVGSALMGRLVSESRRRGTAQLLADASLTAAPFFHRMGFRILRRQAPIYRNRRFKQYLMRRRLR